MSGKGGSELGDRTEEKIERRDDEEQVVEEKHATKGREKKETADGEEKKDVTEEKDDTENGLIGHETSSEDEDGEEVNEKRRVELDVITNGLSVRIINLGTQQYTCTVVPHDGLPSEIDWTQLVISESEKDHIIICRIQQNGEVVLPTASEVTGVLLINNTDDHELGEKAMQQCLKCSLPIFAITKSDGTRIQSMFPAIVEIKVDFHVVQVLQNEGPKTNSQDIIKKDEEDSTLPQKAEWQEVVITNGLKVKEHLFSYAWLPVSSGEESFDDLKLVENDETYPHARLYEIDATKGSEYVIAVAESMEHNPNMQLLLIINDGESYGVPYFPQTKWTKPVAIITAKAGQILKKIIMQDSSEETKINLSLKSLRSTCQPLIPEQPKPGTPIINGLQIILPKPNEMIYLSYAWLPVTQKITSFVGIAICNHPLKKEHILVCKMTPKEDIGVIIASMIHTEYIKMLVIVSLDERLSIDNLPRNQKWLYPIAVVTAHSGNILGQVLSKYPDDTIATIHLQKPNVIEAREVVQRPPLTKTSDKSLKKVRQMIYHNQKLTVVCENEELLQRVMSELNVYEENPSNMESKEFLTFLKDNCGLTFQHDFPFYFIIIHRILHSVWKKAYDPASAKALMDECVGKYANMEITEVSQTLKNFRQRGDSTFQFKPSRRSSVTSTSTFAFLENCMAKLHDGVFGLYPTMLLIITYYFFNNETKKSRNLKAWNSFVQCNSEVSQEEIKKMPRALALIRELKLPVEVGVTTAVIGDFLGTRIRPFRQVRDIIYIFTICFSNEKEFYEKVVKRLRQSYHDQIVDKKERRMEQLFPRGTSRKTVIMEGLGLLTEIMNIVHKTDTWKKECHKWLRIMIDLVDISVQPKPELLLEPFLSGGYEVCRDNYSSVVSCLYDHFEKCVAGVSVEKVTKLYTKYADLDDKFWKTFLEKKRGKLRYLGDVAIVAKWSPLIRIIAQRYQHAEQQTELLDLIYDLSNNRTNTSNPLPFLLDILDLTVPCKVEKDTERNTKIFKARMITFIKTHSLKLKILNAMGEIINIVTVETGFQKIVVDAIIEGISITAKDIEQKMDPGMKKAIKVCIDTLSQDWNWITTAPRPNQKLSLRLLLYCCSQIPVDSKSNKWVKKFSCCLPLLGKVYFDCDEKYERSMQTGVLPKEIVDNPCELVNRYFTWILSVHETLKDWKRSVTEYTDNENLLDYSQNHDELHKFAKSFKADHFMVSIEEATQRQNDYLHELEKLNIALIQYTDGTEHQPRKWCSSINVLSNWGISFPTALLATISEYFKFPDELNEGDVKPPCVPMSQTFNPPKLSIQLYLWRKMLFEPLQQLVQDIMKFLDPVFSNLKLLSFFHLYPNKVFNQHLRFNIQRMCASPSTPSLSSVSELQIAVESTKSTLDKIFTGKGKYKEITVSGELDLTQDVAKELQRLASCPLIGKYSDVMTGILNLILLISTLHSIRIVKEVFVQYNLHKCLKDDDFEWLLGCASKLESIDEREKLTANQATLLLHRTMRIFCLELSSTEKYREILQIFSALSESAEFYQFLKENKFTRPAGYTLFKKQFALVRDLLQAEDYNEIVLNHLFVAFEFVSPFLKPTQTFQDLMKSVSQLQLEQGVIHLKTVRKNIHTIRLWFSRTEGDTIENVANELEDIMENGKFLIQFTKSGGHSLSLKYFPRLETQKSQQLPSQQLIPESPKCELLVLQKQQIDNFVQKLGFMDTTEGDNFVKTFRHTTNCTYQILDVLCTLRELGHPDYCKDGLLLSIPCNQPKYSAMEEVKKRRVVLEEWQNQLNALYDKHVWLLYYRVPKLMELYRHLITQSQNGVFKETIFFFKRDKNSQVQLKEAIKTTLSTTHFAQNTSPLDMVGEFLDHLFKSTTEAIQLPQRYPYNPTPSTALFDECSSTLHMSYGFTQTQTILLVLSIYKGLPEALELLHCTTATTEQDIYLYMERVRKSPRARKYVVLDIHVLPFHLQEILMRLYLDIKQSVTDTSSQLHLVENSPTVFDEISPFLKCVKYKKEEGPPYKVEEAKSLFKHHNTSDTYLMYGPPGIGKTHYIREVKLKRVPTKRQQTISVNEAFSTSYAIEKLSSLSYEEECTVFFNFTFLQPLGKAHEKEHREFDQLMTEIGWFFFKLFILGYVEDHSTGQSFQLPFGSKWTVYIEVPSSDQNISPKHTLTSFLEKAPTLKFMGRCLLIDSSYKYKVDQEVQLVCKYLQALSTGTIDKLYAEGGDPVKFSDKKNLSENVCEEVMERFMPKHAKVNKITQKTFIQYMARRCRFLDHFPAFNFNMGSGLAAKHHRSDTRHLGSTLMRTMLKEVSEFCDPSTREGWTQKAHQQLIYDFKDGAGSIGLITMHPDEIEDADKERFLNIGIEIPTMSDMFSKQQLEQYLSRSLNVPLEYCKETDTKCLAQVHKSNYVLTLDFTVKMLNIHERYKCGVPAIIEGETGVGKTALVKMLSDLWNDAWKSEWGLRRSRIVDLLRNKVSVTKSSQQTHEIHEEAISSLASAKCPSEDILEYIVSLPQGDHPFFQYLVKDNSISTLLNDPIFSMLDLKYDKEKDILSLFKSSEMSPRGTAILLNVILTAEIKQTFFKLNVHEALKPGDIDDFFGPVFTQALYFQNAFKKKEEKHLVPFVTVYLDEINTSSCLGLFKEIIIDKTLLGKVVPKNVFVIASCNPHRGDVLSLLNETEQFSNRDEQWLKGAYYVRKLHPTLQYLMWDYGSLNEHEEKAYVNVKMRMLNTKMDPHDVSALSDLIVESQRKMREYAKKELISRGIPQKTAVRCAKSCVSQRDIQRVFIFYKWFKKVYEYLEQSSKPDQCHRRAVMVSLGIVYFMRLTSKYRIDYRCFLDNHERLVGEINFSKAYKNELDRWTNFMKLPPGISKANPLKENLLAIIACSENHVPLVIVGAPGSSKTLSFNVAVANLKGQESKNMIFRNSAVFQSLEPHFYQCSRRTTSTEIEKIFDRAISRQKNLFSANLPSYCVVFMDEAGLPENKYESLKALHYHLDAREVSFVAISNHILDAAKTNRAVSLIRPKSTGMELYELAADCILKPDTFQSDQDKRLVASLGTAYLKVIDIKEFSQLYGLRDFIYFIIYLRRKSLHSVTPQLIVRGLERCFNGTNQFEKLCHTFLEELRLTDTTRKSLEYRSLISILKASMDDKELSKSDDTHSSIQSEVRYKILIDPSADESLVRLLFTFGILKRQKTKIYVCSEFPPDRHSRVNMIAQIRHSVAVGHTVLLSQTDDIHESFYDLFNQRFRSIEIPGEECRYYANIAIGAHSKPCRVNPYFQCVVVVNVEELQDTPAPFLNRFEKYFLSHENLLASAMKSLSPCLQEVLRTVKKKVEQFTSIVAASDSLTSNRKKSYTLYGFTEATLDSLILEILPMDSEKFECQYTALVVDPYTETNDIHQHILLTLISSLRDNAMFHVEMPSREEIQDDADNIFKMILSDPEFKEELEKMKEGDEVAVRNAVDGALHSIYHSPKSNDDKQLDIFLDYCLVIAVLVQWLVSYFCKRLMQLMTPEALINYNLIIPHVYQRHYLRFQEHFSIQELVKYQISKLERNHWNPSHCGTKLICFTRTSSLIQQIPTEYPGLSSTKACTELLQKYIHYNLEELMILKISAAHSQTFVENHFTQFMESSARLMLVIVRMPEVSRKMVNHLRILIEEAENENMKKRKLFVVLLHFPSTSFFDPCYPSLYLQGWDHYYLDSIGHGTLNSQGSIVELLEVKEWFKTCCFQTDVSDSTKEQMCNTLVDMLNESLMIVAPKVLVPTKTFGGFNKPMSASERIQAIRILLIEMKIGSELAKTYCLYWTPQVMNALIGKLTNFTHSKKSTLNLTDSIQSTFRSRFFDFLVYMLNQFNDDYSLDILFENLKISEQQSFKESNDRIMIDLCRSLITILPKPDLTQLPLLCNRYRQPLAPPSHIPKFPLFGTVCSMMEDAISTCRKAASGNASLAPSLLASSITIHKDDKSDTNNLCKSVLELIKERNDCLHVCLDAMQSDESGNMWECYCKDFLFHKLHIKEANSLTVLFLQSYVGAIDRTNVASCMASLHIHIEEHRLKIPQLLHILRPISKFSASDVETTLHLSKSQLALTQLTSTTTPTSPPKDIKEFVPDVYSFIVALLYEYLKSRTVAIVKSTLHISEVTKWCDCYHDIIIMPGLLEGITKNFTNTAEEKFNTMHSTFLVIQHSTTKNPAIGLQLFSDLSSVPMHSESMITQPPRSVAAAPRLKRCIKSARRLRMSAEIDFKSYLESQLAHFFSTYRTCFNFNDLTWFLNFCNQSGVSDDPLHSAIPKNVLTFYMSRVLLLGNSKDDSLGLFNPEVRREVGLTLMKNHDQDKPGPYLPPFYRLEDRLHVLAPSNLSKLMHQPLADFYFQTALEQLHNKCQNQPFSPGHLIRMSKKMEKDDDMDEIEITLRSIEKQAVLQLLLQQVAQHFRNPRKMQNLFPTMVIDGINACLKDAHFGGSEDHPSCHGLVLMLHMKRQLKSTQRLLKMVQSKDGTFVTSVHGVQTFQKLIETNPPADHHLFVFIGRKKDSDLGILYHQLLNIMANIHNKKGKDKTINSSLLDLAKEWCCSDKEIKLSNTYNIKGKQAFKMIIWLCVYYEVFRQKKGKIKHHSTYIADVLKDQCKDILEPQFIYLLQSFLHPNKNMIRVLEAPMIMDENAERFHLMGNRVIPVELQGEKRDPIFELFNPLDEKKLDSSDQELCDALANMIAAVVAWEPHKIHLWYHIFGADELKDSFMTGFLYNDRVQDGRSYDCGVELAADGTYGRPDYLTRANSGSFSLHSLYLMLWCNFGAFCISMLTQPDAQQRIGKIITSINPVRHYCVSQLRSVWLHIQQNMKLSSEERVFFLTRCMYSLIELSTTPEKFPDARFDCLENVQTYERMWHDKVFLPNSENIHSQFEKYYEEWQPTLLKDLSTADMRVITHFNSFEAIQNFDRCLEAHYPFFPTIEEFHQTFLSRADIGNSPSHPLYILSQLTLNMPRLEAAGSLLPDLIQFYNWLHTEGAYKLEKGYALNNGFEEFISKMDKRYPAIELHQLFERMRASYNKYVEVVGRSIGAGACANMKRQNRLYEITDETPIISLLSVGADSEDGMDWLYIVMKDIIDFHNNLIDTFMEALPHSQAKYLQSSDSSSISMISSIEVNENSCIIPPSRNPNTRQLQLIRSRCVACKKSMKFIFDFESLQKDMVWAFVLGKSKINDVGTRKEFKFYAKRSESLTLDLSVLDLSSIEDDVEGVFKVKLPCGQQRELECEYHDLDYHNMMEIVTGLRTAVDHLIKAMKLSDSSQTRSELQQKTIEDFLQSTYEGKKSLISSGTPILRLFGFKQLSNTKVQWLGSRKLPYMYSMLEFFVQWVKDGMYDFHHLPFVMKRTLSDSQRDCIRKIPNHPDFKDYPDLLVKEIRSFEEVLLHNEENLRKRIAEREVSLVEYLKNLKFITDNELLTAYIPKDVYCQHYVATRISLRGLLASVQQNSKSTRKGKWSDYVENLWHQERLRYLREVAIPYEKEPPIFAYDPETGLYGYQYDNEEDEEEEVFVHMQTETPPDSPVASLTTNVKSYPPTNEDYREESTHSQLQQQESFEETHLSQEEPAMKQSLIDVAKKMSVAEYLKYLKLPQYIELFKEEEVDGKMLWEMCHASDDELADLGVTNAFHRRKIKGKLEEYLSKLDE